MQIQKLVLNNFRNIKNCELDVAGKQVILIGENGQGKTNLLEAVYLLCYGSSFRTQNLEHLVQYGKDYFYLKSELEDTTCEVSFNGEKKSIRLNGKEIKDRKDLIYTVPTIVFSHDDIEFVRGEPEHRRRFFDQTMSMYDVVYFDELRRYKQVLRQRNVAIKEGRKALLDVYDLQLATLGLPIVQARANVVKTFLDIFPDMYNSVTGKDNGIKISYRPSWKTESTVEEIVKNLQESRETDFKMMTTTSGPHRDRFVISDNSGVFVNGASTGQMRLASLVFRSAQSEFFRKKTSVDPVYLIDDVLLELDPDRRSKYLDILGSYSQAFFTFLPREEYSKTLVDLKREDTKIYSVKEGEFCLNA